MLLHKKNNLKKLLFITCSLFGLACFSSCKKESEIDLSKNNFTCSLEDSLVNGKYRFSWNLEGSSKTTMYDATLESNKDHKIQINRPSITYFDFDPEENTSYTMTIKLKSNDALLKKINFEFKAPLSNENIDAKCHNDNVDISFKKQLENSKCYIQVNEKTYIQDENNISLTSQDINFKAFTFSERLLEEKENELNYTIVDYSSSLQIQIPSDPVITFKPISGDTYSLKCDKFNQFKSFDIDLTQENESIIKMNDVLKKDFSEGKLVAKANNINESDISLKLTAHGERTSTTLTATKEYTKTFKYVIPVTLDVVDGYLKINNSNTNVNKYLITTTAYSSGLEESLEISNNDNFMIPFNECYSLSVLPILSSNYFTKASTLPWFQYFKTPVINVLDKDNLMYEIEAEANTYSNVVISLKHNNEVQILKNINFENNRAVFSLFNLGTNYIDKDGEYLLEVYVAPSSNSNPTLKDGTEYKAYPSAKVTSKIYKTKTPDLEITKSKDGKKLEFKTIGYDDYRITIPGIIDEDSFIYANGISSYSISNELIEDTLSREIRIVCTKKMVNDKNTIVLPSEPFVIQNFKTLTNPTARIELITRDNNKYFSFNDGVNSTGNYYIEVYYINSASSETLINSLKLDNNYMFAVNDLFDNKTIAAGEYRLAIASTSSLDYELNSIYSNYYFNKLSTPTLNKNLSTKETVYWSTLDTVAGYNISINGNVISSTNNNYRIDETKLEDGLTNLLINSYGRDLTLDSEPLTVKLYKIANIEIGIKDSVLSYQNNIDDVSISTTTYLYDGDNNITDKAIVGNQINLKELTSNSSFNIPTPKTYTLYVNFIGNSKEYDFIYGYTKTIDFIKQPYPVIDTTGKKFVEKNEQKFIMAIDNKEFIYNDTNAPIPAGAHTIYFVVYGDGINTIDSNEWVYHTGGSN